MVNMRVTRMMTMLVVMVVVMTMMMSSRQLFDMKSSRWSQIQMLNYAWLICFPSFFGVRVR